MVRFEHIFAEGFPVVVALHLPPFPGCGDPAGRAIAEIERFAVENAALLAQGGADAILLQDQTAPVTDGEPVLVAYFAAVARAVRTAFPRLPLGVIANHHGARTPLAVARAAGAQFVRLKVYVGAMVKAGGIEQGCAVDALRYRAQIGAEDIAIVADVFDRSGSPLGDIALEDACDWAVRAGRADALVLTGHDFLSSLQLIGRVRSLRLGRPLLLGGGATAENVAAVVGAADGVIVSSALKRTDGTAEQRRDHPWDEQAVRRFVGVCRQSRARAAAPSGRLADA